MSDLAIVRLFDGLTRCAPGHAPTLARAVAHLPPDAHVLDAGCGRGADLPVLLAQVPKGAVTAVDLTPDFITHIRATFPQVRAEVADMLAPPHGPFDLIWAGGSAYGPGVAACLAAWRGQLRAGGRVVFTELCWARPDRSDAAQAFWAQDYPAMGDVAALNQIIADAGWRVMGQEWLPHSAWADYYDPVASRLDAAQPAPDDAGVLAGFRAEIDIWRQHGVEYGYILTEVEPA